MIDFWPHRFGATLIVAALLAASCSTSNNNADAPTTSQGQSTNETTDAQQQDEDSAGTATGTGATTGAPRDSAPSANSQDATEGPSANTSADAGETPAGTIIGEGSRWATGDSELLFDQETLHTFELTLSSDALATLDADPAAEQWVEGSLTFDGETLDQVGIRYKGSIGAFIGCLTGPNIAVPSGAKTCTKLSMKVKINWLDSNTEFYGQRKLQFHSMNNDPSHLRERLGYWLFNEMGVAAPRSVHARLIINGEFSGLYTLTEQIDGRFTRANFEDGTGNLYKEVWPLDADGTPNSETEFIDALKTNEDEDPSVALIAGFATDLAAASGNERDVVEQWTDIENTLRYIAVDRTIRNDDGAFHWYCIGSAGCRPHNYYWYEDPTRQKLTLIPWDLDHAFENIISDINPITPIADGWGEITNNCNPFPHGLFNLPQRSAACDPLTATWTTYVDEYEALTAEFVAGPFSAERVNAVMAAWTAQIASAVAEAADQHPDAVSVERWEMATDSLNARIEHARTVRISP